MSIERQFQLESITEVDFIRVFEIINLGTGEFHIVLDDTVPYEEATTLHDLAVFLGTPLEVVMRDIAPSMR